MIIVFGLILQFLLVFTKFNLLSGKFSSNLYLGSGLQPSSHLDFIQHGLIVSDRADWWRLGLIDDPPGVATAKICIKVGDSITERLVSEDRAPTITIYRIN